MSATRATFTLFTLLILLAVAAAVLAVITVITVLIVRACRKKEASVPPAPTAPTETPLPDDGRSLPERLKEIRVARGMTQEFVAESLGVSRQAVSKWETGAADPSTGNLLALAKLYGISAADLLR